MKNTIAKRTILSLAVLGLVLAGVTDIFVGLTFRNRYMKLYSETAHSYTRTIAALIDGDRINEYYKARKVDSYYLNVQRFIITVAENADVRYLYVFRPIDSTRFEYLWDAENELGTNFIGEQDVYGKDGYEKLQRIYSGESESESLMNIDLDDGTQVATAISPIRDSDGEIVAFVGVDLYATELRESLLSVVLISTFVIFIIMILSITIYYIRVRFTIIRSIETLQHAAEDLVDNIDSDKEFHTTINSGDEIEALSHSFEKMSTELRTYIKDNIAIVAEKERIGAELGVAAGIQQDMLPSLEDFPWKDNIDVHATMVPAKDVGGDFYDFFFIDDTHAAMVIADVSGKGVPAALFMVIAKTLLKDYAQAGRYSPAEIISNVNNQLCDGNTSAMFVTVWLAIMDLTNGHCVSVNAGHENPMVRRAGAGFIMVEYEHSPVLGVIAGMEYEEHDFEVRPGDTLFVYTDGVAEANNSGEEQFGTDRILDSLNRDIKAGPKELIENVSADLDAFTEGAPQFDDITMVALTFRKNIDSTETNFGQ